MKTPMQELLERVKEYRDSETSPLVKSRLNSVYVDIVGMLEKEKEVMVDFAYKFGDEPLSEIPKWYDKQFKTKER